MLEITLKLRHEDKHLETEEVKEWLKKFSEVIENSEEFQEAAHDLMLFGTGYIIYGDITNE